MPERPGASKIEGECLKDEQVEEVRADVGIAGTTATVHVHLVDAVGPFEFTLTVTDAVATLSDLLETPYSGSQSR